MSSSDVKQLPQPKGKGKQADELKLVYLPDYPTTCRSSLGLHDVEILCTELLSNIKGGPCWQQQRPSSQRTGTTPDCGCLDRVSQICGDPDRVALAHGTAFHGGAP